MAEHRWLDICNTAQAAWLYMHEIDYASYGPLIEQHGPPETRDLVTKFSIVVDPLSPAFSDHVWDYDVVPIFLRLWFLDGIRDPETLKSRALQCL